MSEKNREARRSARERLQQERAAEKTREKRKRVLVVASTVVGVLGVVAVIGVVAAKAGKDGTSDAAGPVLAPSGVSGKDELAIPVGAPDAPSTLTVWEDFRCPACAQFENAFRSTIHELENKGQLKVEYHLATIIDGNMGGTGSLHAANAAACAQDVGKFAPYHDELYKNQPAETDDAFAKNSRLLELAGKVEGLESAPGFRQCVQGGDHNNWVNKSATAFRTGGFTGTPTVLLNGEAVFPKKGNENITPDNLKKWVKEANRGKKPGTAPPETTSVG
ncbi:DsbA family protein [Streptomyces liangshanensis]|uniref:Thioredoxin domain-containing protein n=1 Tax=Streptomyces liangshanensis TaxID=2717324 RepID=A0A6G9H3Z2_9ACTN|nr:thioredoxin domain-containing protein [Streptomyces liangshanensis]QIQ05253.1 thioredoxin domain-containing protein [Streptomyces liangshanensis]